MTNPSEVSWRGVSFLNERFPFMIYVTHNTVRAAQLRLLAVSRVENQSILYVGEQQFVWKLIAYRMDLSNSLYVCFGFATIYQSQGRKYRRRVDIPNDVINAYSHFAFLVEKIDGDPLTDTYVTHGTNGHSSRKCVRTCLFVCTTRPGDLSRLHQRIICYEGKCIQRTTSAGLDKILRMWSLTWIPLNRPCDEYYW